MPKNNIIHQEEIENELNKLMITYDLTPEEMIDALDMYAEGLKNTNTFLGGF